MGGRLEDAHLAEEGSRDAQQGADSQDDQRQFPPLDEADDKGRDEGGVGLDQQAHFVANALLDLVDVTARRKTTSTEHELEDTGGQERDFDRGGRVLGGPRTL